MIQPAPRTASKPAKRSDLIKDGEIIAEEQYLSVTSLAQILLSQLMPEHIWTVET